MRIQPNCFGHSFEKWGFRGSEGISIACCLKWHLPYLTFCDSKGKFCVMPALDAPHIL